MWIKTERVTAINQQPRVGTTATPQPAAGFHSVPLPLPYDDDAGHRVTLADGYDAIQDETSSPLAPNAARYLLPAIYVLVLLQKQEHKQCRSTCIQQAQIWMESKEVKKVTRSGDDNSLHKLILHVKYLIVQCNPAVWLLRTREILCNNQKPLLMVLFGQS